MKQKLFIILALVFLVTILIGLNAATYVQKEKIPDNELNPNRSTYNSGATGTRAVYEFLSESGYPVTRWRDPVSKLKNPLESKVDTFVVIGKVRREFTNDEITQLLNWVSSGGRLVIIDRDPPAEIIATTANWSVDVTGGEKSMSEIEKETLLYSVDPSNQIQMTSDTQAGKPLQPTVFSIDINGIQSSKFASSIVFKRHKSNDSGDVNGANPPEIASRRSDRQVRPVNQPMARPTARAGNESIGIDAKDTAPVSHFANDKKTFLVDFPFEDGRIIFLSDPYIFSNGGIRLADNIQLAANLAGAKPGVIAFDEFHQGYSNNENRFFEYFSGTPVVAIFFQLLVIIGLVLYSQSRRFARALPASNPDRLSKLEYVSAMAQLQQRTRAYDLAIENIYSDFRRRVSRYVGVDNHTTARQELAQRIAERSSYDAAELEDLMFKCADITHGEPTGKKQFLDIVRRLRKVEESLGLLRRDRRN